jgi:formyltetrahydrofolate-dependent phosphoribosylglycinamide formyltransferase
VTRLRVAVLISGRGSNMMALLRAAAEPGFPADIPLVIADTPEAGGVALARAQGVEALAIDRRGFGRDRAAHEAAIDAALRARGIGLVCLAGYMRLLSPVLVQRWEKRMLNIHPSLLPAFPGLDTHARALKAGVTLHGCTVHWVTEGMDEGPILAQAAVPVLPDDTADSLAARVLIQEHRLYPLALCMAAGEPPMHPDSTACLLNPADAGPPPCEPASNPLPGATPKT